MGTRWLLYDGGCSVCAALAREVEALSAGRLRLRSLREPEVQDLLDRARPGWRWEPMLLEIEGERVRVFAGWAMRWRLLRVLGPARAWRVAQAVARRGGPVLGVDWERRDFLRRALGTIVGIFALQIEHLTPTQAIESSFRANTKLNIVDIEFEDITSTAKIASLTYSDGKVLNIGLKLEQFSNEQRIYFSLLLSNSDIELFEKFVRTDELKKQSHTRSPGLASIPYTVIGIGWGSWISWDGNRACMYISHDLATQMAFNLNICTVVTGIVSVGCAFFGNIACSALVGIASLGCSLTSSAIQYWDALGAPGFYICATASPPNAWIEP